MKQILTAIHPSVGLLIWTTIVTGVFITLGVAIARFVRRQKSKAPLMLLLYAIICFSSCKKEDIKQDTSAQEKLIKNLGFTDFAITKSDPVNKALSFNSIEEAKAFLMPFKRGITSQGVDNITYRIKPDVTVNTILNYSRNNRSGFGTDIFSDLLAIEMKSKAPSNASSTSTCIDVYRIVRERVSKIIVTEEYLYTICTDDDGGTGGGAGGADPDQQNERCNYGNPTTTHYFGWAGYSANFTYTKNSDGTYTVKDFSSNVVGFTPGISWEHGQGSAQPRLDANGNLLVTVTGIQKYNLIVEGIGTVFTQNVTLDIKYNACKGTYTMTSR